MFFDDEEYHNNQGNNGLGRMDGVGNNGYSEVPMMSEEARQAQSSRLQKESSERTQYMEIAASAGIIFFISLNLIVYHSEPNCGDF